MVIGLAGLHSNNDTKIDVVKNKAFSCILVSFSDVFNLPVSWLKPASYALYSQLACISEIQLKFLKDLGKPLNCVKYYCFIVRPVFN